MARKEKFRLIRLLGAGGFAQTYVAEVLDVKLRKDWGEEIAIKIPLSKEKEEILVQELILNAIVHTYLEKIDAPNIVRYLGPSKYDGKYIMAMEYVPGGDLRKRIGNIGSQEILPIEEALDISKQVCKGLIEIHKIPFFHRDIKPGNIMYCEEDGTVKITDLGIGKMISISGLASTTTGTLQYMSRELIKGKGALISDIYSLGVTMYEMLAGGLPFEGDYYEEIIEKICKKKPVPLTELNEKVDERLNAIVLKAMEKNIEERYKTAKELLKAIENYEQGIDETDEYIDKSTAEAKELFGTGKFKEAESKLKALVENHPQKPLAYLGLGEFYNRRQKYKAAIEIFEIGIKIKPDFALLHRDLALSFYQNGNRAGAINSLKKAVSFGLEDSLEKHANILLELWEKK